MPLAAQEDVETLLQTVFDAQPDPIIVDLLERAQAVIENYCHRSFEHATGISETLDGRSEGTLRLSKFPVTAISAVRENTVRLVVDEGYVFYSDGRLVRGNGNTRAQWTSRRQGVVVTYSAGYEIIPRDLADVCARLAARWYQAGAAYKAAPEGAGAVQKVSLEGSDSVTYRDTIIDVSATGSLTADDRMVLDLYRKWVVV